MTRLARYAAVPPDEPRLREGAELFNAGRYFESHEVWESLWHEVAGEERGLLQGLIQLAAALHHHTQGNMTGAEYLLSRARARLARWRPAHAGIDLDALFHEVDGYLADCAQGRATDHGPRLRWR